MKKHLHRALLLAILISSVHTVFAQCSNSIHHWESCVKDNDTWKYIVPAAAIPNWTSPAFNDAAWASGTGGMGYGDGDDSTLIPVASPSVYMRNTFTIADTSVIGAVVFCMDFDDGYIAYLNGTEIARANMTMANPAYNALATGAHEARLYWNSQPVYVIIPAAAIDTLLKNGNNVLCVQTHTVLPAPNDMTSRPFLQLGITNAIYNYSPVPAWFSPPFDLYTNLPVISINTHGQVITDNPRIIGDMGIIDNGANMNCIHDPFNGYNGKIQIEYRGGATQGDPKIGYGFSTVDTNGISTNNVSLLGMPEENDWVLNPTYIDRTFQKDVLMYDLARAMGWYTTRVRYTELVLNGEYMGIFILQEKVKQDKNRVDIERLTPSMNTGDALTGGYVYKVDWINGAPGGMWVSNNGVNLQYHDPNVGALTPSQETYLKDDINSLEAALFSATFTNPETGYRKKVNPYSFADDFIIQEFSNNIDGYRASNYLYKDRDSKCGRHTFGPFWDFNLSFGFFSGCFGANTQGWQITGGCGNETNIWINKMLTDQWFKNILHCRWSSLRSGYLSNVNIFNRIDSVNAYLHQAGAAERDSAKWGLIIWSDLQHAVDSLKDWITLRTAWMDANMYTANQPCNATAGLSVVIDEINFHSDSSTNAGDWLELYNYGASAIDLSYAGIFDGDGYKQYCVLPNNTSIAAGGRLVVYSDSAAFTNQFPGVSNKTGPLCFKLNNSGQKIIIRDKDNKHIYSVDYKDTWQCTTDGNGRTLQLTNTAADPNLISSWYAGCMGGSPGVAYIPCTENLIYSEINYNSSLADDAGDWIELHNKTNTAYALDSWTIRDGSDNNFYTFPAGTSIPPLGYIVAYSDATKFAIEFPAVTNKVGPLGFGFSSTGDVARVFDNTGKLQFSVCYGSANPWPTSPNGSGYTLENGQYSGNQNESTTWFAGCYKGSPGYMYDPNCPPLGLTDNIENEYITLFPNPAKTELNITSSLQLDEVLIYDNIGRILMKSFPGNKRQIDISGLPNGIYHLQCKSKGSVFNVKFVKQQ
jgi:hypothetical protein